MYLGDALKKAEDLNRNGLWKDDWYYYVSFYEKTGEWFISRRLKKTPLTVAVFIDGEESILEKKDEKNV